VRSCAAVLAGPVAPEFVSVRTWAMEPQVFTIGRSVIRVVLGSITHAGTDVIVSSDDGHLSHAGGVSQVIYAGTGGKIAHEIQKIRGAHAGDVLVTSGGNLPAKYILHAVTPGR